MTIIRVTGGVVNASIVMAGAEAIVKKITTQNARYKLVKYAGHINITKYFAVSLLRCMGLVKRKGTKSISGLDDKRRVTLLLAITKSGSLLSPQPISVGKSDRCLP